LRSGLAFAWGRAGSLLVLLLAVLALGAAEPGAPAAASSPVRLGDDTVFSLAAEHRGKSPGARATQTSQTLEQLARGRELPEVRVELSAGGALIAAGATPIIELSAEDARLAGDANLESHASKTAGAIRRALEAEHKRGQIAGTVFSFSLLVFFALIAFYLIKKVASIGDRSRVWLEEHGDRVLTVSVKNIELVRPAVLKSSALILLSLLKLVGQFGIFYAWLVIVLSLFESTRGYTERLTGFVLTPLSLLLGRAVSALPLLVVAGFAALAVLTLVRFVGLFLASVARRETFISWLPADLAAPASVLVRGAIVLAALVFAAPIVTGSTDSSLGRSGTILLIAIGLAATPLFASAVLGACLLFGRRLAVGEYVEVRGRLGRISSINLLELRLDTADQTEHRVPHLLLFASPLERLGNAPRFSVEVLVPAHAPPARVLDVLTRAGELTGRNAAAELIGVEPAGARYRVTATCSSLHGRSPLFVSVLEALADAGLGVGGSPARDGSIAGGPVGGSVAGSPVSSGLASLEPR